MYLTDTQRNKLFALPFSTRSLLGMSNQADREAVKRGEMTQSEYRLAAYNRNITAVALPSTDDTGARK